MIDSILKLSVGMYVDVLIEGKEWKTQRIIEIRKFNNNTLGGVFVFIEFEDHSRYTIWNDTPLKFVCETIRINTNYIQSSTINYSKIESNTLDNAKVGYCIESAKFNGANKDYFTPGSYTSCGEKVHGEDPDLPDMIEPDLYHESFGGFYKVDKDGNKI